MTFLPDSTPIRLLCAPANPPWRDEHCDFTADRGAEQVAALLYDGAPLDSIAVEGDISLAQRFATLFPLPPKVEHLR